MGGGGTPKAVAVQPGQSIWGHTAGRPRKKDILAMGLHKRQCPLLMPLLLLVVTGLESIDYVPQLSSTTLLGKLTQSTFTLEQPLGQFENVSLSDPDSIWLVVAHSNAIQNFAAPQKVENIQAPDSFNHSGYYLTLRTSWVHYQGNQSSGQLRLLRVGNDTNCSLKSRGCNSPLPGAGPYRVKFLAMSAKGPVAETEWSKEIYLQQAQTFRGAPGPQSKGTVVIIAFSSILLAILIAVFVILVISTCFQSCWSAPQSGLEDQVQMRQYHTHHMDSLRAERSS